LLAGLALIALLFGLRRCSHDRGSRINDCPTPGALSAYRCLHCTEPARHLGRRNLPRRHRSIAAHLRV
jgi:hypothetical protein